MISNRHFFVTSVAPIADALLIAAAGWVAYHLRWGTWTMAAPYLVVLVLGSALGLVCLPLGGAYQSWQGRRHWQDFGNTLPGLVMVALILMMMGTLTKSSAQFSRLWMGYWFTLAVAALFTLRWGFCRVETRIARAGGRGRRILIVGAGDSAAAVARHLLDTPELALDIVGFLALENTPARSDLPAPVLGDINMLQQLTGDADPGFDELWIAASDTGVAIQAPILEVLRSSCIPIRYVPDLPMLALLNQVPSEVAGMTVIDLNASPLSGFNAFLKLAFDKLLASVALVLVAPVLLVIAILIRLDSPGPVIFRQQRHGWDGKVINVLKFRTMKQADRTGPEQQAVRDDARVTRIGRILRKTSLDELPQFINVLRGEMSVVGPRPHPLSLNRTYIEKIDAYMQRHRVRPGITGWAQVHGLRGETDTLEKMQKRVEYDLYYIEHWSLWLDIKIILRTITSAWAGENAY